LSVSAHNLARLGSIRYIAFASTNFVRTFEDSAVKRILSNLVLAVSVSALVVPGFTFAQQRAQTPTGSSSSSVPVPGSSGRKTPRGITNNATAAVERDFDEALRVVQEEYVDGKKLDYNNVFKSSIIGMLRSLDPHSNYYDREEFDELKTDQRSEYLASAPLSRPTPTVIKSTLSSQLLLRIPQRRAPVFALGIALWKWME